MTNQTHMRSLRFVGRPFLVFTLIVGVSLGEAWAFVPPVGKIVDQVARANRAAGRAHSLVLSVALRSVDGRTIAQGELATDSRGVARLELTGTRGGERHLLRGGEYLAARRGSMISGPAPYLPPIFLLQAGNGDRLLSGILSQDASGDETILGRHDGAVCYVLGGRDLQPAGNASASEVGSAGPKSAVWVQRDDYRIVRIDHSDGTRFVLGPAREFDGATLPAWIRIERPGAPPTRLEILSARRSRFDLAVTFGIDWLLER